MRVLALLLLVGVLAACAPGASAPVPRDNTKVCQFVRDAVRNGVMPLKMAEEVYPWCAPFEAPE